MKDYGPALRQFLLADATIAGMVATRITPQPFPQAGDVPAITYHQAGGVPVPTHSEGTLGHRGPRIQIDCWAGSRDEAVALDLAVASWLAAYRGTMGEGVHAINVQGVFAEEGRGGFEQDAPLHRIIRDYHFWFEG